MKKIPIRHISATVKEPAFTGSFTIRKVGQLLSGKDMVQELHRHSFFYVLVLEKGAGEHSIDFTSYPVTNYTVFFMRPGQVHQLMLKKESTGYLMEFSPDFYSPSRVAANAAGSGKLMPILNTIFQEYSDKQERYLDVIKSSLDIFFIELLRALPQHPSKGVSEYTQQRLEELLAQIEHHNPANKQVSYYAEKLHLTTYQLNAITKASLGKTCSEVINDHVILEAKRHLLATSSQINQIAWQLGYEDVSYFIRFFKKHTGYSPEAFRHNFT